MKNVPFKETNLYALISLELLLLAGWAVISLLALANAGTSGPLEGIAVGLLISGATAMVGGVFGFLFGIPRVLQIGQNPEATNSPPTGESSNSAEHTIGYQANTNLEQISDWLTKILVGVGLTQLANLRDGLQDLSKYLAPAFGEGDTGAIIAGAVIVYFSFAGFFFAYLWTRLYLLGAFREAELLALRIQLSGLGKEVADESKPPVLDPGKKEPDLLDPEKKEPEQ